METSWKVVANLGWQLVSN